MHSSSAKLQKFEYEFWFICSPVTLVLGLTLGFAGELVVDLPRPLVFFSSVSPSKSLSSPSLTLSSLLISSLSSKSLSLSKRMQREKNTEKF